MGHTIGLQAPISMLRAWPLSRAHHTACAGWQQSRETREGKKRVKTPYLRHQLLPPARYGHVERKAFQVGTGPYLGLELRELVRGATTGDHGCSELEKRDHDRPADALAAARHYGATAVQVELAAKSQGHNASWLSRPEQVGPLRTARTATHPSPCPAV